MAREGSPGNKDKARNMESSYSIEPGERLVRLKIWGELHAPRLIEVLDRVGADPRFTPGMCAIADFREACGSWDYSEIQRFRDYLLQLGLPPREVRWAALVKPGALVAIGHVLILISEAVGARVRLQLFENPQQALRWVRGERA